MSQPSETMPHGLKGKRIEDSEIRALIRLAQQGDITARESVFMSHLYLADRYAKKYKRTDIPEEDVYQEACYGILVAIDHYDPDRQEKFSTLASIYIKKYIYANIIRMQAGNLPGCYRQEFYLEVKTYISLEEAYKEKHGFPPDDAEMARQMKKSLKQIKNIKRASVGFMSQQVELKDNCISEKLCSPSHEDAIMASILDVDINDTKIYLSGREREILKRRFGFTADKEPQSWAQISAELGITIETARLDYNRAIREYRIAAGVKKQ